jgi:hypothetical protein
MRLEGKYLRNMYHANLMSASGQPIGVFIYDLETPSGARSFLGEQENNFHSDSLVETQMNATLASPAKCVLHRSLRGNNAENQQSGRFNRQKN